MSKWVILICFLLWIIYLFPANLVIFCETWGKTKIVFFGANILWNQVIIATENNLAFLNGLRASISSLQSLNFHPDLIATNRCVFGNWDKTFFCNLKQFSVWSDHRTNCLTRKIPLPLLLGTFYHAMEFDLHDKGDTFFISFLSNLRKYPRGIKSVCENWWYTNCRDSYFDKSHIFIVTQIYILLA